MPVCVFMNKEYATIEALKVTTLRDLGLESGNASLRLLGQLTEKPLDFFLNEIDKIPSVPLQAIPSPPQPKPVKTENPILKSEPVSSVNDSTPPLVPSTSTESTRSESFTKEELDEVLLLISRFNEKLSSIDPNVKIYKPVPSDISPANSKSR